MIETVTNVLGEDQLCVADGDADAYIASIANDRKCPVLSIDSDFYIFPIKGGYIPYGHLDWDKSSVRAQVYYYDEFAFKCGLQDPSLLAMIPALLGDNCIQPSGLIVKRSGEDEVAAAVRYVTQFSTLNNFKKDKAHQILQHNIDAAYKTYCCKPQEGTCLKFTKRAGRCQKVPKFVIDQFRKGKWAKMLMDTICFDEVDHRVAIEDVERPWCHLIGLPIREVIYGILRGVHGVTEYYRVQGTTACFQNTLIEAKMPIQLSLLTTTIGSDCILHPEYPSTIQRCREEIILDAAKCTVEFKKNITKPELWLFFVVSYFWYWNMKDDYKKMGLFYFTLPKVNKDIVLKAIILYAMRRILSITYETSHLPTLPDKPSPPVVHALSRWQSVYHDLLCLNQLLLEPLPPMQISKMFNCTTIVKFFVFITDHGDRKLVDEMNLNDSCKKLYDDLYSLITVPPIGTITLS